MGYSTHKNSSMAQEQNYQVNYTINVEATEGTRKVQAFADSIKSLILAKNDLTPAVNNIQKMMNDVDKISGRKAERSGIIPIKWILTRPERKRSWGV